MPLHCNRKPPPTTLFPLKAAKQEARQRASEQEAPRVLAEGTRRRGGDELSEVAAAAMAADLGFEETELRLGLPGGGGGGGGDGEGTRSASGKRGFAETIDLKLKLEPAAAAVVEEEKEVVDAAEEAAAAEESPAGKMKRSPSQSSVVTAAAQPDPAEKPRAPKAQVVGWPPVRSFRKNIMSVQSEKGAGSKDADADKSSPAADGGAAFVKVSLDGAPYLRKVDLKMYKSYQELSKALEKMFSSFTIGSCGSQGMNGMNESKLVDLLNGSEYVPTYEDKDGDWMLVGDVPWEMFVESCKRLRIMKGSEAIGLAPRAMEKCKNRS